MFTKRIFGLGILLAVASMTNAAAWEQPQGQQPPPGCKAWNADLPPAWAGWGDTPAAVTAARAPADAAHAVIAVGKKASVTLLPAKTVRMAVETPDIDPPPDSHKGMLSFRVPADGYYWVASSEGLWIDVVENGAIQDSTDHGPGPNCASVRKAVQFMLKAGDATIQLSDNKGPRLDIMVVRVP